MMIVWTLIATLAATDTSLDQTLAQVQTTYRDAGDLTASFQQIYVEKLRGTKRRETGRLWAKKDGRVRWTYQKPIRKDFIFNGDTAYFYEPENAQVTIFEQFKDSQLFNAMRFLWGQGDLDKKFHVQPCRTLCQQGEPGDILLELVPKQPIAAADHILLVVDSKTYRVRQSVVFDPLGNRTEYHFTDVQFDAKIDHVKFDFTTPQGVSVLRATAEAVPPGSKLRVAP